MRRRRVRRVRKEDRGGAASRWGKERIRGRSDLFRLPGIYRGSEDLI